MLEVMMPNGALLDTSFFLRFLNEKDELFPNADKYYRYFLQKEIKLFISTISIAEYCVGGTIEHLPLKNLIVLPFNIKHAEKAGEFGRILYEAKKDKKLEVVERPIIINDAKLFAQAETDERIDYYITSDARSINIYNSLKDKTSINFTFINIRDDHSEAFGILNL
jgi:predicted nucleic acid-binding protein